MENQETNIDKMRRRIRGKAAKYVELLNNPVGKDLIAILEEEFCGVDLRGSTVEDTYYNLGSRDLVEYLKQLQRINEREKPDAS